MKFSFVEFEWKEYYKIKISVGEIKTKWRWSALLAIDYDWHPRETGWGFSFLYSDYWLAWIKKKLREKRGEI